MSRNSVHWSKACHIVPASRRALPPDTHLGTAEEAAVHSSPAKRPRLDARQHASPPGIPPGPPAVPPTANVLAAFDVDVEEPSGTALMLDSLLILTLKLAAQKWRVQGTQQQQLGLQPRRCWLQERSTTTSVRPRHSSQVPVLSSPRGQRSMHAQHTAQGVHLASLLHMPDLSDTLADEPAALMVMRILRPHNQTWKAKVCCRCL